jgi:hypothetical protein
LETVNVSVTTTSGTGTLINGFTYVSQKVLLSGGGWQDAEGNPLALGTVQVYLQQDVEVHGVQLCAGIKDSLSLDSSGNVTGSPTLWGPVVYQAVAYSAKGEKAWKGTISVPNAASFSLTPA